MSDRYALDTSNAKFLGVCAGFARWADVNPLLVRVTAVLATLFLGPLTILAYLLLGMAADKR